MHSSSATVSGRVRLRLSLRLPPPAICGKTMGATPDKGRAMTDFSARRIIMVDTQVRPNDVTRFPIIEAMLSVPRENFVPEALREAAYAGENLALGGGRVMLEPRTLAKMLDALDVRLTDRALDVGCGYGYAAEVLARMAASVVALESDAGLSALASDRLKPADRADVTVVEGPLAEGASAHAPFDIILVEGGVEEVPAALISQLADGGRIACIFCEGALGTCRVGHMLGGHVSWRFAFNATAPVLADFARKPAFAL
jgi:protein-L-isoaspartate(D-aspartate) O-methyltransferase